MSYRIFADTSGLVAYFDDQDASHGAAVAAVRQILREGGKFLTSNYVFDEVVTRVLTGRGHAEARRVGESVLESRVVDRLFIEERLEADAWQLFLKYDDQVFSFTDCTSFALMKACGLTEAFTFDRDFVRAGFAVRPRSK